MEEILNGIGVPIVQILIAGFMIWATFQACKAAIAVGKPQYILYTAAIAAGVAALLTFTHGRKPDATKFDLLFFGWIMWGGWLAANLCHKLFARYLEGFVSKAFNGKTNGLSNGAGNGSV